MLGALSAPAFGAPDGEVTGSVKDTKGNPVVGAIVSDEAQKAYTMTDPDGLFSLVPTTPRITVSCLGYQTKTLTVKAGQRVNITLEEENTLLEDAVVVGYAVQSKANLTGAVSTVDVTTQMAGRSIPDVGRGHTSSHLRLQTRPQTAGRGFSFLISSSASRYLPWAASFK